MTDEFSFTPVASTLFMNRENHENRENFRALITTIPFNDLASLIWSAWPQIRYPKRLRKEQVEQSQISPSSSSTESCHRKEWLKHLFELVLNCDFGKIDAMRSTDEVPHDELGLHFVPVGGCRSTTTKSHNAHQSTIPSMDN
jgi:hypothetical protein